MNLYLQALIDGLLIGGVYATMAVGLSLAFGVMRIVNWCQGEILMVSMYIAYFVFTYLGLDPYLIVFLTAAIMFAAGWLMQNAIFSNLLARTDEREPISVLLFTAGLGMVLSNAALVLIGSNPLSEVTRYTGQMLEIGPMLVSVPKLISFVFALALTIGLYVLLQRSEIGRAIRATSQNRSVATLMGINQKKIYNLSFGLSLAMVGASGALLIPYYPVSTTVGNTFSFKTFVIVVLGGMGSVPGALLGGLLVGIIEKVIGQLWSDTYAQVLVFVVFIGVLLFKPNGLMGEKDI